MYYNQFLDEYVIMNKKMENLVETIHDFIASTNEVNEVLKNTYFFNINLSTLETLLDIQPTDIGEIVITKETVEKLQNESITWASIYMHFKKEKITDSQLTVFFRELHCLMNDFQFYLNIGVSTSYVSRHILN